MGIQLLAELQEKGGEERLWDFCQQILGPEIHHAARTLCGRADSHSLCGPAQLIKNKIGKWITWD